MLIPVNAVHFDESFCLLVLLIVGTVLGPNRVQHMSIESIELHLFGQFFMGIFNHLISIVLSFHD